MPSPSSALLRLAACALGASLARSAAAQEAPAECPPEEWFCPEAEPAQPAPEVAPGANEPAEVPEPAPVPKAPALTPPPPGAVAPRIDLPLERDEPEQAVRAWESPWSVHLRVQGVMLGSGGRDDTVALGGMGASLRYAVHPHVALDLGIDSFLGEDYNGYERTETSLSFSSLLYLNPEREIRTYGLFGLNSSVAYVDVAGDEQTWSYLGAQAGLGLDFVLNSRVSVDVGLIGFIRGRTDERAAREPEFSDGLGRLSNTSGGALLRGGVVLLF